MKWLRGGEVGKPDCGKPHWHSWSLRGYSENNDICCSKVSGSCGCGFTVPVSIRKKQCTVCFKWVGDMVCVGSE